MAMKQLAELCIEAGMPIREMDLFETYLAGGAIARKLRELQGQHRDFNALTPGQQAQVREYAYAAIPARLKGK